MTIAKIASQSYCLDQYHYAFGRRRNPTDGAVV
jgi:hypothetical protein